MGRKNADRPGPAITTARAARLYRLMTMTAGASRTRKVLLARLKLDLRGFYRDLEFLRALGVEISFANDRYQLVGDLDTSLAALPFPDPGLSIRDALQLSRGNTEAHRKLRRRIDALLGTSAAPGTDR